MARHIITPGLISKTTVYCPEVGEERKFSFTPKDFCPICQQDIVIVGEL